MTDDTNAPPSSKKAPSSPSASGPAGPTGATGATGAAGATGATGASGDPDNYVGEAPGGTSKYFQVYVPSWAQDADGNNLSSFIRLGTTADGGPGTQFQQPLLQIFTGTPATANTTAVPGTGFFDDPRQRYDPHATNDAAQQSLPGITGAAPDGGLTVAQRQAETANLVSKGGWMDHSDGNRITTTQGDKVEVIRGNYQLIVLGRQDSVGNGATSDMSGGLSQPNDATPANLMRLEWVNNYDGTWRSVEECQKGDVHNVIHGDVFEEQYGNSITAVTGSELEPALANPETYSADPSAANGTANPAVITQNNDLFDPQSPAYLGASTVLTKKNPTIVERTWADSISGYTGSSTTRIPSIHEETWASAITEVTDCSGVINSTTRAGVVEEVTEVGSINEVTTVGSAIGVTIAGSIAELEVALNKIEIEAVLLHTEVNVGGKIEIFGGVKLEISGPEKWEFGLEKGKLVAASVKAEAEETRLLGMESKIAENVTKVAGNHTEVDGALQNIADAIMAIAGEKSDLAASIILGI